MPQYTEQELEHYERLVADFRDRVAKQQSLVDNLAEAKALDLASSVLEQMTETLALFEQKRLRILKALAE